MVTDLGPKGIEERARKLAEDELAKEELARQRAEETRAQAGFDLDKRLKKIESLLKIIGIPALLLTMTSTVVTICTSHEQGRLYAFQAEASEEKRRINVSIELAPKIRLSEGKVYVDIRLQNNTVRQVQILMLGIRIWKHNWDPSTTVATDATHALLFSDTIVSNLPPQVQPVTKPYSLLRQADQTIILAGGELGHEHRTYTIPQDELKGGVWVQGWAFIRETDTGECVIVGPPLVEGSFPTVCEREYASDPNCYKDVKNRATGCKQAEVEVITFPMEDAPVQPSSPAGSSSASPPAAQSAVPTMPKQP